MRQPPTLIFIPGGWHKPSCYNKTIRLLEETYSIKCVGVTLPSMQDCPEATFKDDIDAARAAIIAETSLGRDVFVIAHSYGGMVGNSSIKDLTPPRVSNPGDGKGYVQGIILIASGFTVTGLAFMDPFFGHPPPSWRVNKDTGYAELVKSPRELFYHDVPEEEANSYVNELTTQSLKALFEGGEHAYAGWLDVPDGNVWYIGTVEDVGMPVLAQRLNVGLARGCGVAVNHIELVSSHSPFISMPEETVAAIRRAISTGTIGHDQFRGVQKADSALPNAKVNLAPWAIWSSPMSWLRFGIPLSLGRAFAWVLSRFYPLGRSK